MPKHRIKSTPINVRPIHCVAYIASPNAREFKRIETKKMIVLDAIEPAQTELEAPIVLALKNYGSPHYCIHYRKAISVTVEDSYLIQRVHDCVNILGDKTMFSTLTANNGYRPMKLAEEDRDKMVFTSHMGFSGSWGWHSYYRVRLDISSWNGCHIFHLEVAIRTALLRQYSHILVNLGTTRYGRQKFSWSPKPGRLYIKSEEVIVD